MASKFVPRLVFPIHGSIPRSYYLGHHKMGLKKMGDALSTIDYIIECRDFRVPVASVNPVFENALKGKPRVIVYTKKDLGGHERDRKKQENYENIIRSFDPNTPVFFSSSNNRRDMIPIFEHLRKEAIGPDKIVGCRIMVVGMPNIGKSTLINSLRVHGARKPKAAPTGDQPGVTRKIPTPIKILEREDTSPIYVLDTPGIFMPYVSEAENMLKLALVGCVKDSIISPMTLADYLLYHMNLKDPNLYYRWCHPTNDISVLINSYARYAGFLAKRGEPNIDLAALHFVRKWRAGHIGGFIVDDLQAEVKRRAAGEEPKQAISITQALKEEKLAKKRPTSDTVNVSE